MSIRLALVSIGSAMICQAYAADPPLSALNDSGGRLIANCTQRISERAAAARSELKRGDVNAAAQILDPCAPYLSDADAKALLAQIKASQRASREKVERAERARAEKVARADLERRKKEGVSIGMSQQEVLQSQWGRPKKINRTTTVGGIDEQWVYGGGNYLYFTNGVLRTIQN